MFFWYTSGFGGFVCLAAGVLFVLVLTFWHGQRRSECPICHRRNLNQAKYCGRCGHRLED